MKPPKPDLNWGPAAKVLSDLIREVDSSRRLVEQALGPSLLAQASITDALLPMRTAAALAQDAVRSPQFNDLYGPNGTIGRFTAQMATLDHLMRDAVAPLNRFADQVRHLSELQGAALSALAVTRNDTVSLALARMPEILSGAAWANANTDATLAQAAYAEQLLGARYPDDDTENLGFLAEGLASITQELDGRSLPLDQLRTRLGRLFAAFVARYESATSLFERQSLGNVLTFLALLLAAVTFMSDSSQHSELVEEIKSLPSAFEQHIDKMVLERLENAVLPQEDTGISTAVLRSNAIVRDAPSSRSGKVARLGRGELVQLLQRHEDWLLVAFYDPLADRVREGWLYGKLLKGGLPSVR